MRKWKNRTPKSPIPKRTKLPWKTPIMRPNNKSCKSNLSRRLSWLAWWFLTCGSDSTVFVWNAFVPISFLGDKSIGKTSRICWPLFWIATDLVSRQNRSLRDFSVAVASAVTDITATYDSTLTVRNALTIKSSMSIRLCSHPVEASFWVALCWTRGSNCFSSSRSMRCSIQRSQAVNRMLTGAS